MIEVTTLGAIVLGGALSALGGASAILLDHKLQRRRLTQQDDDNRYSMAFTGMTKIVHFRAWMSATNRTLAECFAEADEEGLGHLPPAIKVREIIGDGSPPQRLTSSELQVCLEGGDPAVISECLELEANVISHAQALERYNERARELQAVLVNELPDDAIVDGISVSGKPINELSTAAQLLIGTMNGMLGDLLEGLEQDIPRSEQLLDRYRQTAFPKTARPVPRVLFGADE